MSQETTGISITVRIILFAAFAVGVAACIYVVSQGKLTERETALLGILL